MEIYHLSPRSSAVYITTEELAERALTPETVDGAAALALTGTAGGASATVEAFPGRDGLLLFLRRDAEPLYFVFRELNSLIAAAAAAPRTAGSALYLLDGRFLLEVRTEDGAADGLAAFGTRLAAPPGFAPYLREHGRPLLPGDALAALRAYFDS